MRNQFGLKVIAIVFFISSIIFLQSCGQDYKQLSTENGRRYLLDLANDYLTSGHCEQAIDTLTPLYNSIYVDNEIRMTYASAWACAGGFNFASLIASLKNLGSGDIWSAFVAADYSASYADSHVYLLQKAADYIRTTSTNTASYSASLRNSEANIYMVFIQMQIIASTISMSIMGNADRLSGHKTQTITGLGNNLEKCNIEVAFATIKDSLSYVNAGSTITTLSTAINKVCTAAGGNCPTNVNPNVCTAAEQVQGAAIIAAIDADWSF